MQQIRQGPRARRIVLGRHLRPVARPVLASKGRSAVFLLVATAASFGSLGLLYTRM